VSDRPQRVLNIRLQTFGHNVTCHTSVYQLLVDTQCVICPNKGEGVEYVNTGMQELFIMF